LQELTLRGDLLQEWNFQSGMGYLDHRESLYGPPPNP
jgi:hypothetical protein